MPAKTEPKLLSRDDIFGAKRFRTKIVPTPEWGGSTKTRGMTGLERGRYELSSLRLAGNDKGGVDSEIVTPELMRMRIVAICAIDADDKPLFTEADVLALGELDAAPLERVAEAARELSGLTKKDMETLTAGLKADPNGSTGSD